MVKPYNTKVKQKFVKVRVVIKFGKVRKTLTVVIWASFTRKIRNCRVLVLG